MKFSWIVFLLSTQLVWAEPAVPAAEFQWPDLCTQVRLISVPINCGWRQGRPFAPREQVAKILKLSADESAPADLDLGEALIEKGWMVQTESDGTIVAYPPAVTPASTGGWGTAVVRETSDSRRAKANFLKICAKEHKVWVKNHPQQALLDSVGSDLARQARRPVPWTFAIVQDSSPNAACTGEGMVYITTSLLKMLDRDELAGVLSHEIAHGARQHLAEDRVEDSRRDKTLGDAQALRERLEQAEEQARRQYIRDIEDGRTEQEAGARRQETVASAREHYDFSMRTVRERVQAHRNYDQFKPQTDERQADLVGMRLAEAAGYQPDGLVRALEKLQAANFHSYGRSKTLGAPSHPPIAERIKTLRELLRREGR